VIRQTALFDPVGLGGLLYWYALWGIHRMVFAGMLRNIALAAEKTVEVGGVVTVMPEGKSVSAGGRAPGRA